MGYRRRDISAIFLWQGALIAAAGSVLGCLLGALMTWGVSHIPIRLRGLFYTNYFLVTWDWRHYVFATLLAILAVFIASYVPARRAAELPRSSPCEVQACELGSLPQLRKASNATLAKRRNAYTRYAVCLWRSRPEASTPWSARRVAAKARCSIFSVCWIHLTPGALRSNPKRYPI